MIPGRMRLRAVDKMRCAKSFAEINIEACGLGVQYPEAGESVKLPVQPPAAD